MNSKGVYGTDKGEIIETSPIRETYLKGRGGRDGPSS